MSRLWQGNLPPRLIHKPIILIINSRHRFYDTIHHENILFPWHISRTILFANCNYHNKCAQITYLCYTPKTPNMQCRNSTRGVIKKLPQWPHISNIIFCKPLLVFTHFTTKLVHTFTFRFAVLLKNANFSCYVQTLFIYLKLQLDGQHENTFSFTNCSNFNEEFFFFVLY